MLREWKVGTVRDEALLFRLGYFNEEEKALLKKQAVGDICSRFFDAKGNICSSAINDRTIGVELEDLRLKERAFLQSEVFKLNTDGPVIDGAAANIPFRIKKA